MVIVTARLCRVTMGCMDIFFEVVFEVVLAGFYFPVGKFFFGRGFKTRHQQAPLHQKIVAGMTSLLLVGSAAFALTWLVFRAFGALP